MELVKITNNGVSAKDLYDFLFQNQENKTKFSMWIKRRIVDYKFVEDVDFVPFLGKSTGGRKIEDYAMSVYMAKHLAMVEKTDIGFEVRDYFIKCEEIARQTEIVRLAGKEIRKTLTEKIKDTKENERMKGFGYSSYTKLAYKLCDIEYKKQANFRGTLKPEQLKQVKNAERMIKSMLDMGNQYLEIKNVLSPIFDKAMIGVD